MPDASDTGHAPACAAPSTTPTAAAGGEIVSVTADAAYDTIAFYEAAETHGATVVVPPRETASVCARGPRSCARDHTVESVKQMGQRQWKKSVGYHRQARAENAFFRYKAIFGGALRARTPGSQATEAVMALQRAESDDGHRPARVLRDPSVSEFRVRHLTAQRRMVQQRREMLTVHVFASHQGHQ